MQAKGTLIRVEEDKTQSTTEVQSGSHFWHSVWKRIEDEYPAGENPPRQTSIRRSEPTRAPLDYVDNSKSRGGAQL